MMATLETRVTVPDRVLFRDLTGEAVLLELESGQYFGLNETGTRMWSLLAQYGQIGPAFWVLSTEYDVPIERLREEFCGFAELLIEKNLLTLL